MAALNTLSDQELLDLLKQRNREAFAEVYSRHWKKMLQVAWNHTKDKVKAEDIVHEVFITLWERKVNVAISDISRFLTTAVKFSVFKYYHREQRRIEILNQNFNNSEYSNDMEEKLDALFLQNYINDLVEELPEKCKMVFRYSRVIGMKNSEIALELGISEKAVEANLTRALKILRNNLIKSGIFILIAHEVYRSIF